MSTTHTLALLGEKSLVEHSCAQRMRYLQWKLCSFAFLMGQVLLLSGCGSDYPEVSSVRGFVEFDGSLLPKFDHAAVIFTPTGGRLATSVISPEDGSFELSTYSPKDGARLGQNLVTVSATVDDPNATVDAKYPALRFVIPEKFADRDESGLAFEVKPGGNVIRIKIRSDGTGEIVTE